MLKLPHLSFPTGRGNVGIGTVFCSRFLGAEHNRLPGFIGPVPPPVLDKGSRFTIQLLK